MSLFNVYPLFDITPVRAKDVYVYDENDVEDNDMVVYNYFANNLKKLMSAKNNLTVAKI